MTPDMIDRDPESFYHDEKLNQELARVRQRRLGKNPNAYADGWAYGRSTESFDALDSEFHDGAQTDLALETLRRLKNQEQPFFLALGYYRPHLPFVAPKKYWDLYKRDRIPMASNPFLPTYSPIMAMNSAYELKGCYDLEHVQHPAVASVSEETARRLKHGYYASVSFVDACFGRLLNGLEEPGLDENTIIVVWGDHGWKLGEQGRETGLPCLSRPGSRRHRLRREAEFPDPFAAGLPDRIRPAHSAQGRPLDPVLRLLLQQVPGYAQQGGRRTGRTIRQAIRRERRFGYRTEPL